MREPNSDSNNNIVANLHPYEEIDEFLGAEVYLTAPRFSLSILLIFFIFLQIPRQQNKVWISDKSAVAFSSKVPENLLCSDLSPVVLMKSIKNSVEMAGKYSAVH